MLTEYHLTMSQSDCQSGHCNLIRYASKLINNSRSGDALTVSFALFVPFKQQELHCITH